MAKPREGFFVFITELEGDLRSLTFLGPSLPKQGVDVGVKQRSVSTRYPGSSVKSTQMLGSEDDDIVLEGELRDSQLGISGEAKRIAALMVSMCRAQRYCSLEWGDTILKRGFVKMATPSFLREDVIRYRIEFEVAESDEAEVLTREFTPVDTSQSLLTQILQTIDDAAALGKSAILVNNVGRAVL